MGLHPIMDKFLEILSGASLVKSLSRRFSGKNMNFSRLASVYILRIEREPCQPSLPTPVGRLG